MRAGLFVSIFLLAMAAGVAMVMFGADHSLDRLRQSGVIRVGYAVEAPYAFVKEDGQVSGEAPEIASRIAARLGIGRVAWRQMEFGELIDALLSDRIDVIAAGMFITPERQQRVLFSAPTLAVSPGLLLASGNPKGITSYRQAAGADVCIAVLQGAVEEQILRHLGIPNSRLMLVPDALTGRKAVESGMADALMLSGPTLRWMVSQDQSTRSELLIPPATQADEDVYGQPAFAFHPDARQLQAAWNAALIPYLRSPEYQDLLAALGLGGLASKTPSP